MCEGNLCPFASQGEDRDAMCMGANKIFDKVKAFQEMGRNTGMADFRMQYSPSLCYEYVKQLPPHMPRWKRGEVEVKRQDWKQDEGKHADRWANILFMVHSV
jgi:hypothetical protein